MELQAVRTFQG